MMGVKAYQAARAWALRRRAANIAKTKQNDFASCIGRPVGQIPSVRALIENAASCFENASHLR
jgi:hypothetical protein